MHISFDKILMNITSLEKVNFYEKEKKKTLFCRQNTFRTE